jgi:hypothetical protein
VKRPVCYGGRRGRRGAAHESAMKGGKRVEIPAAK